MRNFKLKHSSAIPLRKILPQLDRWFASDPGRLLLEQEQEMLDEHLPGFFGYHLMQLSVQREHQLYAQSVIKHRFSISIDPSLSASGSGDAAVACYDNLPIDTDSVDVALVHHVLEYAENPHRLLKEVSRVVLPHGYICIIGFNPWSLLGLWSLLARLDRASIWHNRFVSVSRLYDWLTLLDFSIKSIDYRFYTPPFKNRSWLSRFSLLDRLGSRFAPLTGGVYVVIAKKDVSPMTPIRQRWFARPGLLGQLEPSVYRYKSAKKHSIH